MSVEARAFLGLVQREADKTFPRLANIAAKWNSNPAWSTLMLGSAQTRKAGDFGLLGKVGRALGYRVQAEYLRVDQIWYTDSSSDPGDWLIEAFIEHENEISRAEETARKLLQLGPGLKVFISYPMSRPAHYFIERLAHLVRTRHGTPGDIRLLIVLGTLKNRSVTWSAYEIDGLGRASAIRWV